MWTVMVVPATLRLKTRQNTVAEGIVHFLSMKMLYVTIPGEGVPTTDGHTSPPPPVMLCPGPPEKRKVHMYTRGISHLIMETEKAPYLPWVSWSPRRADGIRSSLSV